MAATYRVSIDTLARRRVNVLARGLPSPDALGTYRWLEHFGLHNGLAMRPLQEEIDPEAARQLAEFEREIYYCAAAANPRDLAALIARALCSKPTHRDAFGTALLERAGYISQGEKWVAYFTTIEEPPSDHPDGQTPPRLASGSGKPQTTISAFSKWVRVDHTRR